MALKLTETYREIIQELFDMEQLLDYEIKEHLTNEHKWWVNQEIPNKPLKGTVYYDNEKRDVREEVDFFMEIEGILEDTTPKTFLFDITFDKAGGHFDITNDQMAVRILNTLTYIVVDFIEKNDDLFNRYPVGIIINGILAYDDDPENEKPKRQRVYSGLIRKNIDKLSGNWMYSEEKMLIYNDPRVVEEFG